MAYTNTQESVIVKGPGPLEPVSRTYQYRKVMKPMLERKRRARINRCLDELKELMVTALQSEGENVSKLEKADILGNYQFNYYVSFISKNLIQFYEQNFEIVKSLLISYIFTLILLNEVANKLFFFIF